MRKVLQERWHSILSTSREGVWEGVFQIEETEHEPKHGSMKMWATLVCHPIDLKPIMQGKVQWSSG